MPTTATVKMEDPSFAQKLNTIITEQKSTLIVLPLPIGNRQKNARKVYMSWHKATRSVWLNFGDEEIANRVARQFKEGSYKCLGQSISSSEASRSSSRGGRNGISRNPVAWTVTLSDVPGNATRQHIQDAIFRHRDKPRHIELGPVTYQASDAEVSVVVCAELEKHGPLESFHLTPSVTGKRSKATAWFRDEADARSACHLNNTSLDILRKGRLTVALIQTVKIKVSTRIYLASKDQIDQESKAWKKLHLAFNVYPDASQRFTTLKIEGESTQDLVRARKALDKILSGDILTHEGKNIWHPAFSSNKQTSKMLHSVETDLDVVITRDKTKRELSFHGPSNKYIPTARRIVDTLPALPTGREIDLGPDQFYWTIHGGFGSIVQALGKDVAVFDVVSKRIIINGTPQHYTMALQIMNSQHAVATNPTPDDTSSSADCPICFDIPETPVLTSCKHKYCLGCFENCCLSATSTGEDGFQIKCYGDAGACSAAFTLLEVKEHLSSSILEKILDSSFKAYIQRQPDKFRYCPTPECGFVYRCSPESGAKAVLHTCSNCFEDICTSCHAQHGRYSCAEYKDIASGGYEALEKLKRELNIKDCPKCTTPMEKTEGCNHMTCGGCKAHICWGCLEVFATSGQCYAHMGRAHGGIGIELDFVD